MLGVTRNLATDRRARRLVIGTDRDQPERDESTSMVALQDRIRKEFRQKLHPTWLRHDAMYKGRFDSTTQGYVGRYQTYLMIARRVAENWVQKLKADLFPPSGKWMSVTPEFVGREEDGSTLEGLFRKYAKKYVNIRRESGPFLRTVVGLGTSPVDHGWATILERMPGLRRKLDPVTGQVGRGVEEVVQNVIKHVGPTWRQVDLFLWYIWPYTVKDPKDARLIFEDQLIEQEDVVRLAKTPLDPDDPSKGTHFANTKRWLEAVRSTGGEGGGNADEDRWTAERLRLSYRGLTSRSDRSERDTRRPLDITRGYWRTTIDWDVEDEDDEDPRERWYKVVIGGGTELLQLRRSDWWHLVPSYTCGKFVEVENEFFGYSIFHVLEHIQYLINDVLNQATDGLTWGMNPVAAIDPFAVQDPTALRMLPGAKWFVRKPRENVAFMEPPKDSAQAGFAAVSQLIAMGNDIANVAPFGGAGLNQAGRARGRAVQTLGGMQTILSEAMIAVRDVEECIKDTTYNPMLKMWHSNTLQCLDIDLLVQLEGLGGAALSQKLVRREDLLGDFEVEWLGSTSTFNAQVLSMQMQNFLQQIGRIPAEILAQEGVSIDLVYLLKRIWSVGMEQPDADRIFRQKSKVITLDPEIENALFKAGRGEDVHVSPGDDDRRHIVSHEALLGDATLPPFIKMAVSEHNKQHSIAMMTKSLMSQLAERAAGGPLAALFGGGGQEMPGQAAPGGATSLLQAFGGPGSARGGAAPSSMFRSGNARLAGRDAPGRTRQTNDVGDVMRSLPRGMAA